MQNRIVWIFGVQLGFHKALLEAYTSGTKDITSFVLFSYFSISYVIGKRQIMEISDFGLDTTEVFYVQVTV